MGGLVETLFMAHCNEPKATDRRLVLADALEESGDPVAATFHRWLAENEDLVHGDERDPEDPWSYCVYVAIEDLPEDVEDALQAPMINASGGPESPYSTRVTMEIWTCREEAERDLLAAWRKVRS